MDALTKQIMHESLLETYDRTGVTIFFITHDLEEAIFLVTRYTLLLHVPVSKKRLRSKYLARVPTDSII